MEITNETDLTVVVVGPALGELSEEEYEAECDRLESVYTEIEADTRYRVRVRPARDGEAGGTYYRKDGGDLQILGCSVSIPEDLRDLSGLAWEKYCRLPRYDGKC